MDRMQLLTQLQGLHKPLMYDRSRRAHRVCFLLPPPHEEDCKQCHQCQSHKSTHNPS